jgi:hypothetical protein
MIFMLNVFPPYGSLDCATALLLLQNNMIGEYCILITPKSDRNFQSHAASFATLQATTYSASVVESSI